MTVPNMEMYGMLFEWHEPEAEILHKNRNINFDEICSVFMDPRAVCIHDIGAHDEPRQLITGMSNDKRLLTVVWIESADTAKIIMAFTPREDQVRRYNNEY